ncbi:hypothetical protein ACJ4Z0_07070 [Bifidobacterium catenulatum]|uniref:hypothetical protein n=1 Tax=Bifidobacterium catenulatum TaxID=1686 RepID=UPI003D333CDC
MRNGSDLAQQDRYLFTLPRIRYVMNLAGRVRGFCTSMKDMHGLRVFLTAFDWFASISSLH